eukprot:SM000044S15971  [mRNA]  locus=s44:376218:379494:+ [translate_table: standard]
MAQVAITCPSDRCDTRSKRRLPRLTSAPVVGGGPLEFARRLVARSVEAGLTALADALSESEPLADDAVLRGNWAPVPELAGGPAALEVVAGSTPARFPAGTFVRWVVKSLPCSASDTRGINGHLRSEGQRGVVAPAGRNGPNPRFPPLSRKTPLGKVGYHYFEGDGMLHATTFGSGGSTTYLNRFVRTEGLRLEEERGGRIYWGTFEADGPALLAGILLNKLRFGDAAKSTSNTHIVAHHGKALALMEAQAPVQVTMPGLETVGPVTFGGKLDFAFTAHPKVDPITGDMVFFGYSVLPPYCTVGVVSKDGRLVHKAPLDVGRASMMHDFAITSRHTIIMDLPLTIDPQRALRGGGDLISFDAAAPARIGVMPRFGAAASVKWFDVETSYVFHTLNAYDDGEEVVLHACRQMKPMLRPPRGLTWEQYLAEGYINRQSTSLTHLHEWRLNLRTGAVRERALTEGMSYENPRVNDAYMGQKNKYGYAIVVDRGATAQEGLPTFGSLAKFHLPQDASDSTPVKVELHSLGPGRCCSEAVFVPAEGATAEDDGWLVTYVFDKELGESEVVIVDAQNMGGAPAARLRLPQRVPFGFHANFIPAGSVA